MRSFRNKAADVGRDRAAELRRRTGSEFRLTRLSVGLTQKQLSKFAGVSQQLISLIERGRVAASIDVLCQIAAACGYEVGIRVFPTSRVRLRDSGQLGDVEEILRQASPALQPRVEMPVAPGDPRAADLVLIGAEEIIHVEVERAIVDLQAQLRPAQVKRDMIAASRDVPVRLVIALPDTARNRALIREHTVLVRSSFPVPSRTIWSRIRSGRPIGGDGILFLPRRRQARGATTGTGTRAAFRCG